MGDSSEDESKPECDINKGAITKDLVHKCPSDPGKGSRAGQRPRHPLAGPTRKCMLTLDGYSYVIGMFDILWFLV
jgi:hypothetical protein